MFYKETVARGVFAADVKYFQFFDALAPTGKIVRHMAILLTTGGKIATGEKKSEFAKKNKNHYSRIYEIFTCNF